MVEARVQRDATFCGLRHELWCGARVLRFDDVHVRAATRRLSSNPSLKFWTEDMQRSMKPSLPSRSTKTGPVVALGCERRCRVGNPVDAGVSESAVFDGFVLPRVTSAHEADGSPPPGSLS